VAISPEKYTAKDGTVSWRVRLELGEDPATGKRLRPYITRPTERACRLAAIAALEKHRTGRYRQPDGITVAEFADRYLAYAEEQLRAATLSSTRSAIKCHIKPYLGAIRLQDVFEPVIADWLEWLRDTQELTPPTRRAMRSKLHRLMQQAVEWQLIERNPVTAVKPPKVAASTPDFLDAAAVRRLLAVARGHRYEVFFVLGFATGMRRGELLGARWDDLHLDAGASGEIRVSEQLARRGRGSFAPGELKTPTSKRVIPLPPGVAAQLKRFRAQDKAQRLKKPGWNEEGYIVVNTKGKHTWPWAIDLILPRLLAQAGIERFTPHTMRHTYASLLEDAGQPRSVIQELLGHSSYGMTGHYTHAYRARFAEATAVLGELFAASATRPPLGPRGVAPNFRPNGGLMEEDFADNHDVVLDEKTAP